MKDRIIRAGSFVRHEYLRLISVGCILLFAILPLLTLAFHVTAADWQFILKDSNFWSAIKNSLIYTTAAAAITTALALIAAYLLNTSSRADDLRRSWSACPFRNERFH